MCCCCCRAPCSLLRPFPKAGQAGSRQTNRLCVGWLRRPSPPPPSQFMRCVCMHAPFGRVAGPWRRCVECRAGLERDIMCCVCDRQAIAVERCICVTQARWACMHSGTCPCPRHAAEIAGACIALLRLARVCDCRPLPCLCRPRVTNNHLLFRKLAQQRASSPNHGNPCRWRTGRCDCTRLHASTICRGQHSRNEVQAAPCPVTQPHERRPHQHPCGHARVRAPAALLRVERSR